MLTCLGGDGDAPSCVAVVGFHFCSDVVSARLMPRDGCFVPASSSCASSPLYIIGVGRVFLSDYGLLDDYYKWGRCDC